MMKEITLNSVKPAVKVGMFGETSGVWEQELQFRKGESYLLRSMSGRGKTSVISFIYGLRSDYSGTIRFDGTDTAALTPDQWSRIRRESLSIVFQDLRLFRQLPALDNVLLKCALNGLATGDEVREMFSRLGIIKLADKTGATLSFGEQQRVAIARSLVQPFDFLLMDEPFSHLDKHNAGIAAGMIREAIAKRGASLVMTSLGDDYGIEFDHMIEV